MKAKKPRPPTKNITQFEKLLQSFISKLGFSKYQYMKNYYNHISELLGFSYLSVRDGERARNPMRTSVRSEKVLHAGCLHAAVMDSVIHLLHPPPPPLPLSPHSTFTHCAVLYSLAMPVVLLHA